MSEQRDELRSHRILTVVPCTPMQPSHNQAAPSPARRAARRESGGGLPRHAQSIWVDPSHTEEPIPDLVEEWLGWLGNRTKPASPETVTKYRKSLGSFCRSLANAGEPLVLGSVTPATAARWVSEQRKRGRADEGIASRLAALKAFTRTFVWKQAELTNWDLLEKAPRLSTEAQPKERLSDGDIAAVLGSFDSSYVGERDRALVTVYLGTGCRLAEVLNLRVGDVDRVTGEFVVIGKGSRERACKLGQDALRVLRRYLRVRVAVDTDALWTTAEGEPLTFWGVQGVFRRLRKRTGLNVHTHLLRHTFAQAAIERGAERAAVQDMLGHETDAMTRRYARLARTRTAATMMPKFSPVERIA